MKEAVSCVVSRVQAPYILCSEPDFCLITYTVISETLLQVLVTSTQLYIRKLNTGTACPTKSRKVYLYNVICIIPDFYFYFCNIFISWTKIYDFSMHKLSKSIVCLQWYIFSIKKMIFANAVECWKGCRAFRHGRSLDTLWSLY